MKVLNELGTAVLLLVGFLFVIITLEGPTRDKAILLTIIAMAAHIATIITGENE